MLHDSTLVVEAEDVNARPGTVAGPLLMTIQNNEVPLSYDTPEVYAFTGVLHSIRSKYSMNEPFPSAGPGLCWMCSSPAYRSITSAGRHLLNMRS